MIRTVARVGIDPPQGWERLDAKFDQIRRGRPGAHGEAPRSHEQELIFRTRCAAGMLNWLALAPIGAELGDMSEKQAERLLVPVVAGAFRGEHVRLRSSSRRSPTDKVKQSLELLLTIRRTARRT